VDTSTGRTQQIAMPKSENIGLPRAMDNSGTIARNTVWSSVEVVFGLLASIGTSVAIARVIGKDAVGLGRLGDYQYIAFLTTVTATVGSFGLPATTRKYMAEYLNRGDPAVARATYFFALKIQTYIALVAAAAGFLAILWLGNPHYFWASLLLVAAVVPFLIATVPAQANNASEVLRRNTGPAVAGVLLTAIVTFISLALGWDFVGLSAAALAGACLECGLKLRSVERWLGQIPRGIVPPELRRRMWRFSSQGLALLLLDLVVWSRSDVLFLKHLNPDPRQITFFWVSFSLVDRISKIPALFAGALAVTVMAQYGRGAERLKEMTSSGGRYALMLALPLLAGMACISQPLVLLLYRASYRPMVATLIIMALLAIPRTLAAAPTMLLQATERQGFLVFWGCVCGAVDFGLDLVLDSRYGANGAAFANGAAQTLAALGIWIYVWRSDRLDLRLLDWGRIVLSGVIMSLGVMWVVRVLPGFVGLVVAIAIGAALWAIALRVTAALRREDVSRFLSIGTQMPAGVLPLWKGLIAWMAPTVSRE
jgi:O-antigen/teichoic acid export membrane protein